jgi:hypothetical protein
MNRTLLSLATLGAIILAGCIPLSLNPFYTEKDLSFDPALVGRWGEQDKGAQVSFEQNGVSAYLMVDLEGDSTLKFEVHLFKVGGKLLMDIYPKSASLGKNDLFEMHLIRGHSLLRVDQIAPSLITSGLEKKWLTELLSKDTEALPHVISDDQLVLTATTLELQSFILKHVADENAWEKPSEMIKVDKK